MAEEPRDPHWQRWPGQSERPDLAERVARLEARMDDLTRSINRLAAAADKLDGRLDTIDKTVSHWLGGIAVVVMFVGLVAPVLFRAMGLP